MITTPSGFQFQRAMTVLSVAEMARSVNFYRGILGCDVSTFGERPVFAICQRGTVTFGLATVPGGSAPAVSKNWVAYVYVADADALHRELLGLGLSHLEAPQDKFYNCRDFTVDDPDGHLIAFGHILTPDALGPGLSANVGRDAAVRTSS